MRSGLRRAGEAGPRPGSAHSEGGTERPIEEQWRAGERGRGMAQGGAKAGPCERVALAGAAEIQAFEWVDGAVQRKARIAAGGGEPGNARGKRSQPRGSPGAGEYDGADAAAGNGNAFGAADRRPR